MRKFILFIATIACIAMAFNSKKCEHVYVSVEPAMVKVVQPELILGGQIYQEYAWPTGKQEGQKLICVKCFHQIKQVLDYGKPSTGTLVWPDNSLTNKAGPCDSLNLKLSFIGSGLLKVDTSGLITRSSGSVLFIKGDSVTWIK
jgi:hypothetical protein